ncbi:hypothetical protein CMUS01_15501 [Colletotrichum musicola]|uniref:Uncharacterized protein n=1 Tax=Colletotrichum musicola TaxID=2175873 RepID=A0A8H6IWR6_9PEZI|nr:hypothetical protein CMUS01_15501 [Colletotrichum musicola]
MAIGLLSIPREIRDLILDQVVLLPDREPPLNPTISQDRTRREYKGQGFFDGHDVWVENSQRTRIPPAGSPNTSILLVNQQIHDEAKALLASKGSHYRLDVMYVKECGLWPTWLAVPRPTTRHADSVHVQFRIFDPPSDVDPDWKNEYQFRGTDGGPPFMVWNFYAMLSDYLRYGPTAFCSQVGERSSFVIKNLVIDVLAPPANEKHDRLVPRSAERERSHDLFESFNHLVMDTEKRERSGIAWPQPPKGKEHLIPAEKLAFFMCNQLGGLLSMYRDWADYGAAVYEGIGRIEMRVDGEPRCHFDMDTMLARLPVQPITAWNEEEQLRRQKRFDEWRDQATARRRRWMKKCESRRRRSTNDDMT